MMNLKDLEVIFIDWGGTLVHQSAGVLGECMGEKIDQEHLRDIDDVAKIKMEEVEIPANLSSLEFYYKLLLEEAFSDLKPEQKKKALGRLLEKPLIETWGAVDEKAKELLKFLYPKFSLAILANDTKALPGEIEQRGLAHYFKEILYSDFLGAEKPDPQIFLAAVKVMKTTPERSLYIGDAPKTDIIEGANKVGMRGIIVNRHFSKKESNLYCACKNLGEVIEYFKQNF